MMRIEFIQHHLFAFQVFIPERRITMKLISRALLFVSALASAACFESNAGSSIGQGARREPAAIRLIYFCYQHDHILEQSSGESDQAFGGRLQQGGHDNNAFGELQRRRQAMLATGISSQLESDLVLLSEWRSSFQHDAERYGMLAAEWCADRSTSAAQTACRNYTRFQRGSERRLDIVNERVSQLERRAGLPSSEPRSATERSDREGRLENEKTYQDGMADINKQQKEWEKEKREQDKSRQGNPYQ
jgi:hypothetical protein